jgi:hypothetical protein
VIRAQGDHSMFIAATSAIERTRRAGDHRSKLALAYA